MFPIWGLIASIHPYWSQNKYFFRINVSWYVYMNIASITNSWLARVTYLVNTLGKCERWCCEFRCGKQLCEQNHAGGTPTNDTTEENVKKVSKLKENVHSSTKTTCPANIIHCILCCINYFKCILYFK